MGFQTVIMGDAYKFLKRNTRRGFMFLQHATIKRNGDKQKEMIYTSNIIIYP